MKEKHKPYENMQEGAWEFGLGTVKKELMLELNNNKLKTKQTKTSCSLEAYREKS